MDEITLSDEREYALLIAKNLADKVNELFEYNFSKRPNSESKGYYFDVEVEEVEEYNNKFLKLSFNNVGSAFDRRHVEGERLQKGFKVYSQASRFIIDMLYYISDKSISKAWDEGFSCVMKENWNDWRYKQR